MTAAIRKEVLENGLTILTERIDHLRSISLGVWLKQGSEHETDDDAGVHHFLEHMLFKATENKSTYEIARIIDSIGGFTDAFTSKENTCFYAKVLDEHLPIMLDLFSDILMYPKFEPEDIERERKVVFEEIKMVEDTPGDLVHELFLEHFWQSHPLGRPILGTADTVSGFDQAMLQDRFSKAYVPPNMMITAAGKIDHDELVRAIRSSFAFRTDIPPTSGHSFPEISPQPVVILRPKKDLEQAHLCIGMMGYSATHPSRYAASVLNVILGGGMSSRLFQRLREERGLCYSVYASMNSFLEAGYLSIYAGTARENVKTAAELILQECKLLVTDPVADEELENAKNHLKGNLILSLESSSSRMFNLARNDLYFHRQISTEELLEKISGVTVDDVQHVAMELFQHSKYGIVVVGDLDDLDIRLEDFQIH